ncbi:hypothetical protein BC940DRAFT_239946 [Gongronella butleri]|nr:hypothetical protein BC940DRAFT_239946 [Gongronella butleri]
MPTLYVPRNRHQETLDRGMATFKKLSGSLDGWQFKEEKNGVKLYSRPADTPGEPIIVRGDYHYADAKDVTPLNFSSITSFPGARRVWDSRFDDADTLLIRSRYSAILHTKTKPSWPASARDFLNVTLRDYHGDVMYTCSFAVVDDELKPPVDGYVRGSIIIGGMRYWKHPEGGLGISYITQVSFGGLIPPALAKSILQQIPLCAGRMADYCRKYGFPACALFHRGRFNGESYDHDKRAYTVAVVQDDENDNDDTNASNEAHDIEIECCQQMFSKGIQVLIDGKADYTIVPSPGTPHQKVLISNVQDHVRITVAPKK